MKVLMFGWEFPPFSYGGLGTACKGLTSSMLEQGMDITFVIPKKLSGDNINQSKLPIRVLFADQIENSSAVLSRLRKIEVDSSITPYVTSSAYSKEINEYLTKTKTSKDSVNSGSVYGKNLLEEVYRYAERARFLALTDDYDVIHAHDWLTYNAGIKAKEASGKPLVVHIHATEFDRTGGHPDKRIYNIEKEGFMAADKIIAVSSLTKRIVVEKYGIPENKVEVVHNGIEFSGDEHITKGEFEGTGKTVLFLGRLTIQKGPDQFLDVAKRVVDHDPEVKFVVAGSGDKHGHMVQRVVDMNLTSNVQFAGYLKGADVDRAFRMADVFIMPSVSEPFGLTPLEAMRNGTPTIISKTSGVSEVINNCFKADFWDIDMMSNMILGLLNYKPLREEMSFHGRNEVYNVSWDSPASKCINIYQDVVFKHGRLNDYI